MGDNRSNLIGPTLLKGHTGNQAGLRIPIQRKEEVVPPQTPVGLPITPLALEALAGALSGQAPAAPSFNAGGPTPSRRTGQAPPPSTNYASQLTGGAPNVFLQRPGQANMTLPFLGGTSGFGLSPDQIMGALNTNLQYQQALQSTQQQDFANRVEQLNQATGLDSATRSQYTQALRDEAAQLGIDTAAFNLDNAETPQQARSRSGEQQVKIAKYRSDLAIHQAKQVSKLTGSGGKLSDTAKVELNDAKRILSDWINSEDAKALTADNLQAILAGTSKVRTKSMSNAVVEALKIYRAHGISTLGVEDPSIPKPISIADRIKQIESLNK